MARLPTRLQLSLFAALLAMSVFLPSPASSSEASKNKNAPHQVAVDTLTVVVEPTVPEAIVAREAYFAYLRKFAEKYGFAIRVDPKGEYFAVMLSREDLRVESTNALQRDRFWLGFFASGDKEADQYTRQKVAAMKADLKATLPGTHVLAVEESK